MYCAFTMAGVKLEVDNELTILADGEQANCSSNATAANHSGWPEFPIRQTSGSNVSGESVKARGVTVQLQ